jgi:hypothetical protein
VFFTSEEWFMSGRRGGYLSTRDVDLVNTPHLELNYREFKESGADTLEQYLINLQQ